MNPVIEKELIDITYQRLALANKYLKDRAILEQLRKSASGAIKFAEEAEVPGFESKPMKFGQFENKEFVVMMTDIRKSTDIVKSNNGVVRMFLIFYTYSAVVANIVDKYGGTSTEFLGDAVLNLFDCDNDLQRALKNSFFASSDILYARENILNPIFKSFGLPEIDVGVGIAHGMTIVTRFGYNTDNDLKAFGACVYRVSKLCKGINVIITSPESLQAWPTQADGQLKPIPVTDADNHPAFMLTY